MSHTFWPHFAWFPASLNLEFGGEIVRGVKIEAIGNLFHADVGGAKKLLRPLQSKVLLVCARAQTSVELELFAEIGIAKTQFFGDVLYGKVALQRLPYAQPRPIDKVDVKVFLAQFYVAFE